MDIPENIKFLLFDLDGTLANFNIDYKSMRNELRLFFKKYNISSEFKPMIPSIQLLSEKIGNSELKKDAYKIIDSYELKSLDTSMPITETIKLYNDSFNQNKTVVIITRNGELLVKEFLRKNNLPMPHFISSRDNCKELKPSVEQFKIAQDFLKINTNECLLLGDSYYDEELANSVGIKFKKIKSCIN